MSEATERLYTAEQVRQLDARAINLSGMTGYALMQQAGKAAFDLALHRYADRDDWVVVCGAGNNAGDGYVLARLAHAAGKHVRLFALKPVQQLTGDALTAAQAWVACGGRVLQWAADAPPVAPGLLIDAMLGTGLDRPVEGRYQQVIEWINCENCPVLSIDIPSGLNADSGRVMGAGVRADATICFIGLKRGLFTGDGPDLCGSVIFDGLQVPGEIYAHMDHAGALIGEELITRYLPARFRNSHKGDYGHVLVVGGGPGMPGAARLCGEAALRSGAGLVSIATHPSHSACLNIGRPELMVHGLCEPQEAQSLLTRASVLALGPGLGTGDWSWMFWQASMKSAVPLVMDADGLNLLVDQPHDRRNWVLTPHPAEAARLLGADTQDVQADRVVSAQTLAKRYGATVVLKGCGTVVADPAGQYAICALGNPGMATAGSGDVLTGVIAAFLAQGLTAWRAACLGVVVQAAAGDLGAEQRGQHGLLAGDMVGLIPEVLRRQFVYQG